MMFILVILCALLIGMMIGTVGIGGVLLAPVLILLLGLHIQLAIATSMWSFLFTGMMGAYTYHKKGSIDWFMAGWLVLGIIPASLFGAQINTRLSPQFITVILMVVILYSAFNVLWSRNSTGDALPNKVHKSAGDGPIVDHSTSVRLARPRHLSSSQTGGIKTGDASVQLAPHWLILIGLIVGFGSALTGTGGAVILIPIFLLIGIPILKSVGVMQGIQLPLAIFASMGFFLFGEIDYTLGTMLGIVQALGVLIGAQIAHQLPTEKLRKFAAYALILSAIMLMRQLFL